MQVFTKRKKCNISLNDLCIFICTWLQKSKVIDPIKRENKRIKIRLRYDGWNSQKRRGVICVGVCTCLKACSRATERALEPATMPCEYCRPSCTIAGWITEEGMLQQKKKWNMKWIEAKIVSILMREKMVQHKPILSGGTLVANV